MSVNAELTRKLSDKHNISAEFCKMALERCKGNDKKAEVIITRWKTQAQLAAKNESVEKNHSLVKSFFSGNKASIIKLDSTHSGILFDGSLDSTIDLMLKDTIDFGLPRTAQDAFDDLIKKANIQVFWKSELVVKEYEFSLLTTYNHRDEIGVIVETVVHHEEAFKHPEFRKFSFLLAMHIAANNPCTIDENIPEAIKEQLTTSFTNEMAQSGRQLVHWPLAIKGKIEKWGKDNSLLNQTLIGSTVEVKNALDIVAEKIGSPIKINKKIRMASL